MIHRLFLFRLLIVLGSLTAASTLGEATAQVVTSNSGVRAGFPHPAGSPRPDPGPCRPAGREARQPALARRVAGLSLTTCSTPSPKPRACRASTRSCSIRPSGRRLNRSSISSSRPRRHRGRDPAFAPHPHPPPSPRPAPQPAPRSPAPAPQPAPGPEPVQPPVWIIYYVVPQQSPILVPVNPWVQVPPVVPTYQWVPVQGTITTGKHSGLRKPWHPWSR